MGTCKYCGLKAGVFSSVHKACEEKHKQGVADLFAALQAYFKSTEDIQCVLAKISSLQQTSYLSQEDIVKACRQSLRVFADLISFPISKQHIQIIDCFIRNIPVSRQILNTEGVLDQIAMKLYRGVLVSHFAESVDIQKVEKRIDLVERILPLNSSQKEEVGLKVLDKAASKYLSNGLLSDQEQQNIEDLAKALMLPINNLPAPFQGSSLEKIAQSALLKQIQGGHYPPSMPISAPIMLASGESVIWVHQNVTLYQEKIEKEWVGRRSGYSFRVMKGVYYHTGGSRGNAIEHSTMQMQGVGSLLFTNKNIIFYSTSKSIRIPYKKIVGITPYSDGVEIHRDAANAKRLTFQGFDSWFMMNLMSCLNL